MFKKISLEEWKSKAIEDLKGKDFEKSLVWQNPDQLTVQPFYTDCPVAEDEFLFKQHTVWENTEYIESDDATVANHLALEGLTGGASSICLNANNHQINPEIFCKQILLDIAPVYLKDVAIDEHWKAFLNKNPSAKIHLGINPLKSLTTQGKGSYDLESISIWMSQKKSQPAEYGLLAVDACIFKESGGSVLHEIAFALSALQEHLHQISSQDLPIRHLGDIVIYTSVGNHFFFEIAKLRALRQLANLIIQEYGSNNLKILAVNASLFSTSAEKHTNVLRLTTAAMSAVLGGADAIALQPFENNEDGRRITRNIQHILKEESYFDKFSDPTAGSYYLGHLTQEMKEKSWQLFLEIEQQGGYIKAFENEFLPNQILAHRQRLENDIATRKSILLGVNQFPNLKQTSEVNNQQKLSQQKGLSPIRLSEPFEALRSKTAAAAMDGKFIPLAFLWKYGEATISNARASYAINFLGCAGIQCIENTTPSDWEKSIEELNTSDASIVVFCSDNDSWPTFISKALSNLNKKQLTILAGKGEISGIDLSIFEGCNVLEKLHQIFDQLSS